MTDTQPPREGPAHDVVLSSPKGIASRESITRASRSAKVAAAVPTYVVVGALCGLTWAAALRGWMPELVPGESVFSWLTIILLLAPGDVVGSLLGRAAYLRTSGGTDRRLVFAPVLLLAALLDPKIFLALIRTG